MTKFLGTSSNTLSYMHWVNQDGTVYGIINSSHILDNAGVTYDGTITELLACDQCLVSGINSIALDNGMTMLIGPDKVDFERNLGS